MSSDRRDPAMRNALRETAARTATAGPAALWLGAGMVAMAGAGFFAAGGRAAPAALSLALAAVVLTPGVARPASSPFGAYVASIVDHVGDAVVLAPLAWPLAHGSVQEGAPAVAALGLVFVGAYAQVRARSSRFPVPLAPDGAPERAAILAIGLMRPATFLEPALWIVAALGLAAAARVTLVVWRERT